MKNILDLFEDLTQINNSEWAGPCPKCGGDDRFRVWPEKGRFWCRGCGIRGDAIDAYRLVHDCGFLEARAALGIETGHSLPGNTAPKPRSEPNPWRELSDEPPAKWRATMARFFSFCQKQIGPDVKAWLKSERGIVAESDLLGWNPERCHIPGASVGLPSRITLPKGLAIIRRNHYREVVAVRIRRPERGADPRYWMVRGSQSGWNVCGQSTPILIIVESELDAILMTQGTGLQVFATTSAALLPSRSQYAYLKRAMLVIDALDADDAGQKLGRKLQKSLRNYRRAPIPAGTDPGEAWKAGVDLNGWIQSIAGGVLESQTA
jgi:DNA primase